MKTISSLIYYSSIALYILFFTCGFIIISNSIFRLEPTEINFIVGLSNFIIGFMLLAIIISIFVIGIINFNVFITKKQIEDYLRDKFNQRKLPF
jgi:hypothetical protein